MRRHQTHRESHSAPFEALNNDLFDVHLACSAADATAESNPTEFIEGIAQEVLFPLSVAYWKMVISLSSPLQLQASP
jgi:hypothetical protein